MCYLAQAQARHGLPRITRKARVSFRVSVSEFVSYLSRVEFNIVELETRFFVLLRGLSLTAG